jgi:hypothetical protein
VANGVPVTRTVVIVFTGRINSRKGVFVDWNKAADVVVNQEGVDAYQTWLAAKRAGGVQSLLNRGGLELRTGCVAQSHVEVDEAIELHLQECEELDPALTLRSALALKATLDAFVAART